MTDRPPPPDPPLATTGALAAPSRGAAAPGTVRWGIGDAAAGWLVAMSGSAILGGLVLALAGRLDDKPSTYPLWLVAILQVTLWLGLAGAPIVAGRWRGGGVVRDFGLRFRPIDVGVGAVVGLVGQLALVPLVSLPWVALLGKSSKDLEQPARDLADRATSPVGVVLLVLIVVIGAPLIEELFFRGLLLRALQRRLGVAWAVAVSGLVFGLTHFEVLQFPALAAFGAVLAIVTVRAGRLGPAIVGHLVFNLVTVVSLLTS
ncbi:MAG: CPBP family intramembrane metalloprotease [Actinobacteria bacterium]|nr:CPBP family intramembrane metalloprotease [Actinomycetota bacterium]